MVHSCTHTVTVGVKGLKWPLARATRFIVFSRPLRFTDCLTDRQWSRQQDGGRQTCSVRERGGH